MSIRNNRVAVYGGGVSGLIAAYNLVKKGVSVDLVDPYDNGKIETVHTDDGIVELAANSILYNEELKEMLTEIGVEYEFYSSLGKKKYVYLNGAPKRWPLDALETLKALPVLCKLALKHESAKPKKLETMSSWGRRVASSAFLDSLLLPGLQGVYGADTKNLSASLVLKNLFVKKNKGSVKVSGSISFPGGMKDFVNGLKKYLYSNGVKFLQSSDLNYAYKIISTPTYSLPDFVSQKNIDLLHKVKYKPVTTVTVFVEEKDRMDFKGFGCVFKTQPKGMLGLILNSDLFEGRTNDKSLFSETWIFDGSQVFDEEQSMQVVREARKVLFKRKNLISSHHFKFWKQAFPSYSVGLETTLISLEKQEGLDFFANWTGDLGIGSMVKTAPNFIEQVLKDMKALKEKSQTELNGSETGDE